MKRDLGKFSKARTAPPRETFATAILVGYIIVAVLTGYATVSLFEEAKRQTEEDRV